MRHASWVAFGLAVTLLVGLGCGDDGGTGPAPLTVAKVAGTYQATTLTVTEDGQTTDVLADGGELTLTLALDGRTSGRLFVPGAGEGGGDFEADMAGTWTLQNGVVTFQQSADTFVRDMAFNASPGKLEGEGTFSGVTIRVALTKRS